MKQFVLILASLCVVGFGCAKKPTLHLPDAISIDEYPNSPLERDWMRLRDIERIREVLWNFYKVHKRYPVTHKTEMWQMPEAADGNPSFGYYYPFLAGYEFSVTPVDGNCSAEQNRYVYEQTNGGQDYTLAFCLGEKVGNYDAGVHVLTKASMELITLSPTTVGQ